MCLQCITSFNVCFHSSNAAVASAHAITRAHSLSVDACPTLLGFTADVVPSAERVRLDRTHTHTYGTHAHLQVAESTWMSRSPTEALCEHTRAP
jgi:hypothetical protein